ncbi:MAG: sugar kinase [bacterium]
MSAIEKIVIVTRETALDELIVRFNTREQARFYIEHMGASFDSYQVAHDNYQRALQAVREQLPRDIRHQFIDRTYLPNFTFAATDLVVTLGQDGLVANTAKYLQEQSLLALNPDPKLIDGILIPFTFDQFSSALQGALSGSAQVKKITMAQVSLNDGQTLYAVNDIFIGPQSHTSARYRIALDNMVETQSSSGIIISTGAGSTGWFRSIITGAAQLMCSLANQPELSNMKERYRFDWEADYLFFNVREPFISNTSTAELVFGRINNGSCLELTSHMPQNGVIFSDGIENDNLPFNSGTVARVAVADKKLSLIVRG